MRAVRVVAAFLLGLGRLAAAFIEADGRFFLDHRALCKRAHLVAALAGARQRRGQAFLRDVEPHRELADRVERAARDGALRHRQVDRSEEHPSELQSLMRISYAVFCLKNKKSRIDKKTTK